VKQLLAGVVHQHELAARHFNLFDLQGCELRDHLIESKVVIAVRAHANVEFGAILPE
jgi:hypothetical protein